MTSSIDNIIGKYLAAWNNNTPEAFRKGFAECWADDATYTDPNFELARGMKGIVQLAIN